MTGNIDNPTRKIQDLFDKITRSTPKQSDEVNPLFQATSNKNKEYDLTDIFSFLGTHYRASPRDKRLLERLQTRLENDPELFLEILEDFDLEEAVVQ